jgi:hypothetical protein
MGSGCGLSYAQPMAGRLECFDFPIVESISDRVADSWL